MTRLILFNHIPRTGGTSLRVILNRVYGREHVFFINSKDIAGSLEWFKSLNSEERKIYRVISGHGAEIFAAWLENPFRVTILREPVSLFISQYYYLRESHNSNFQAEVSTLSSLDDYIDYAINNGQDNMMTRFLSGQNESLIEADIPPPDMDTMGDVMLDNAIGYMEDYDAVIDLVNFDRGIFQLSEMLNWKSIPMYRPLNKSEHPSLKQLKGTASLERLHHVLRFDLALYRAFMESEKSKLNNKASRGLKYFCFQCRQCTTNAIAGLLGMK